MIFFLFFCKGGILDVIVYEILVNGNIKEIYKVIGGFYGGKKVND